jgi:23S rRNA pseudouridine1911/1915/1917 synthase
LRLCYFSQRRPSVSWQRPPFPALPLCLNASLSRYTLNVPDLQPIHLTIADPDAGLRLDRVVASHCAEISRTRVQELIELGLVLLNGKPAKGSQKLRTGDVIHIDPQPRPPLQAEPESIPLNVLYEDDDVIGINKPAGMTVHAGAGNSHGTLVNALLGRGLALSKSDDPLRPGIVHRLDKETSGVLLVAKNDFAHAKLAEGFRDRTIQKTYIALVQGLLSEDRGRIELPIARHPNHRTRMTADRAGLLPNSRPARTDWRVRARLGPTTLLEIQLHSGRTHQIRVHFSALRHPVVGDTLYGADKQLHVGPTALPAIERNFLHAAKIVFTQPRSGKSITLTAPLPQELRDFLQTLAAASADNSFRIDESLAGFL